MDQNGARFTPRTSMQDRRILVSGVGISITTCDFTDAEIAARTKGEQGSVCLNIVVVWGVGSVWKPWAPTHRLDPPTIESVRVWIWMLGK